MPESKNKKNGLIASIYEWVEVFCFALFAVVLLFTFICRLVTVDGPSMNDTFRHGDRIIISNLFYTPKTGDVVVLQDSTSEDMSAPIIKRVIATEGETVDIDPKTWTVTITDKDGNTRILDEDYTKKLYKISLPVSNGKLLEIDLDTYVGTVRDYDGKLLSNNVGVSLVDETNLLITADGKKIKLNTETLEATSTDGLGNEYAIDKDKVKKSLVDMRMASAGDLYFYHNAIPSTAYPHTVEDGHVFVMGDNRNNSLDSRLIGDIDERMIIGKAYVRIFPNPRIGF